MHAGNVTTPFGRRPMTLALLQDQIASASPRQTACVDKWKVFRDICEAREILGINDRALSVLNALLSFYPHAELDNGKSLVVFPSNAQLTLRAHGITGTTLRRHIAALVEAGLIHRKDSPNGKRYAHRDRNGGVKDAYGFSLAPVLTRATEFARMAEEVIAKRASLRIAKEHLSICRRDIRKLIAAAMIEKAPGDWHIFTDRLADILSVLPRVPNQAEVTAAGEACELLRDEIINHLETQLNPQITDTSDLQNERHIQNTNTYTNLETGAHKATPKTELPAAKASPDLMSLSLVLNACPQIQDYAAAGAIAGWRDLVTAATVVRMMLGISEEAYLSACKAMGVHGAAISIAYILERAGEIRSAGGYLREMTRRAATKTLDLDGILKRLLRSKTEVSSG